LEKNTGSESADYASGCMVCGQPLIFTPDLTFACACALCGKTERTHAYCVNGHFVCDQCHRKNILERVEEACLNSTLTDPAKLLARLFLLPGLHMHGPEYHSMVPAALVAAYCNQTGENGESAVREALRRGRDIIGGICGPHGACGAGIGVGIAYSVLHRVTPFSREERSEANRMTSLALLAVSRTGGPRCCKRDSMLAVETAMEYFPCFSGLEKPSYRCSQYRENNTCIRTECPYYPVRAETR
jgi:hypothetical protein